MNEELLVRGAGVVSLFCRQNINAKKDLPLRSSEIGLLIYTVKSDTPVTSVMAAEFFKVSKPMITAMVRTLTTKDYLIKTPSVKDKRSFTLTATEKAINLTNTVYDEYFKVMNLLLLKMGKAKYEKMVMLLGEANTILLKGND